MEVISYLMWKSMLEKSMESLGIVIKYKEMKQIKKSKKTLTLGKQKGNIEQIDQL